MNPTVLPFNPRLDAERDGLIAAVLASCYTFSPPNERAHKILKKAAATGRLIDAGCISNPPGGDALLSEAIAAAQARRLPVSRSPLLISVSLVVSGVEWTLLLLTRPGCAGGGRIEKLTPLTALRLLNGEIQLTETGVFLPNKQRTGLRNFAVNLYIRLRYLCSFDGALEPVVHRSGASYDRLCIETALRARIKHEDTWGSEAREREIEIEERAYDAAWEQIEQLVPAEGAI